MRRVTMMKRFLCFGFVGVLSIGLLAGCSSSKETVETTEITEESTEPVGADLSILTYQNINNLKLYADNNEVLSFDETNTDTYSDLTQYVENANDVTYKLNVDGYSDSTTMSSVGLIYDHEILSASYDSVSAIRAKYDDFIALDSVLGEYCMTLYMSGGDIMTGYDTEQIVITGTVDGEEPADSINMQFSMDGTVVVNSDKDMPINVGVYIKDEDRGSEGMYFKEYEIAKGTCKITVGDIIASYHDEADMFSTEEPEATTESSDAE